MRGGETAYGHVGCPYCMRQMLGCVELSRVAKYSRSKRQQIFCLTTLGAQPVNWLNLRNVCIIQLTRFVDSLNSYRGLPTANGHSIAGQYYIVHTYIHTFMTHAIVQHKDLNLRRILLCCWWWLFNFLHSNILDGAKTWSLDAPDIRFQFSRYPTDFDIWLRLQAAG